MYTKIYKNIKVIKVQKHKYVKVKYEYMILVVILNSYISIAILFIT